MKVYNNLESFSSDLIGQNQAKNLNSAIEKKLGKSTAENLFSTRFVCDLPTDKIIQVNDQKHLINKKANDCFAYKICAAIFIAATIASLATFFFSPLALFTLAGICGALSITFIALAIVSHKQKNKEIDKTADIVKFHIYPHTQLVDLRAKLHAFLQNTNQKNHADTLINNFIERGDGMTRHEMLEIISNLSRNESSTPNRLIAAQKERELREANAELQKQTEDNRVLKRANAMLNNDLAANKEELARMTNQWQTSATEVHQLEDFLRQEGYKDDDDASSVYSSNTGEPIVVG